VIQETQLGLGGGRARNASARICISGLKLQYHKKTHDEHTEKRFRLQRKKKNIMDDYVLQTSSLQPVGVFGCNFW
jgi:hypothetical protein